MKNATTIADVARALGCNEKAAKLRLVALGYVQTCSRCGGSGHYSYNQMDGTRCFGCLGGGKSLVRLTAKIVAEAKARQDAGELDAYFARNAARMAAKRAIEPAAAALDEEVFKGAIYSRYEHNGISAHVFVASDYFRAVKLIGAAKDAGFEAELAWKYHNADAEKVLATIHEMTEYARQINAAAAPMLDAWFAKMAEDEVAYQAEQAKAQAEYEAERAKEAEERKAFVAQVEADRARRYGTVA